MKNRWKKNLSFTLTLGLMTAMALPMAAAEIPMQNHVSIQWLPEDVLYLYASPNSECFTAANSEFKTALLDKNGNALTAYIYDDLSWEGFHEGLIRAAMDFENTGDYEQCKWGFVDQTGAVVIPLEYDAVGNFSEGLAPVGKRMEDGRIKYGYINKQGELVIPYQFDYANPFSEGLAVVETDYGDYHFIDAAGTYRLEAETAQYGKLDSFSEGLAAAYVTAENRIDFIDSTGLALFSVEGNTTNGFSECLAMVGSTSDYDTSRYGFIDMSGNWITPMVYTYAGDFSNGLAFVDDQNHRRGYINTAGELVIPMDYVYGDSFSSWIATAATMGDVWGRDYGCINTKGEVVIPFVYDELQRNGYGTMGCLKQGNSWGIFTYTPEVTLTASSWATESVNKAVDAGLIPSNMSPDLKKSITRDEFAGLAVELYEAMSGKAAPAPANNPFTDTDSVYAMQAYELGITGGTSATTFSPDKLITREQASVMLTNVYKKLGGTVTVKNPGSFADDAAFSSWARESVYFMAENNIVSGMGENRFDAKSDAQSQAALVMALNMLQNLK